MIQASNKKIADKMYNWQNDFYLESYFTLWRLWDDQLQNAVIDNIMLRRLFGDVTGENIFRITPQMECIPRHIQYKIIKHYIAYNIPYNVLKTLGLF